MKSQTRFSLVAAVLALWGLVGTGCQSITLADIAGEKYEENSVVERNKQDTFLACRKALETMRFEHTRGSPARDSLEMASRVMPGTKAELPRQRTAILKFTEISPLETGVSIGFWEYDEDTSAAGVASTTGRRMRAGTIYEAFWDHLDAQLKMLPPVLEVDAEPETGS
jgi:hypothetical protein